MILHISSAKQNKKTAEKHDDTAVKHMLLFTVTCAESCFFAVRCFDMAGTIAVDTAESIDDGKCISGITIPVRQPYWLMAYVLSA